MYTPISISDSDSGNRYHRRAPHVKRDIYLGLMRLHILHHSCEEAIFGTGMMEELRRHGYKIGPGTMYPMLHRMEEDGFLGSRRVQVNGKIRRTYRATPKGRRFLKEAGGKVKELFVEMFEDHFVELHGERGGRRRK